MLGVKLGVPVGATVVNEGAIVGVSVLGDIDGEELLGACVGGCDGGLVGLVVGRGVGGFILRKHSREKVLISENEPTSFVEPLPVFPTPKPDGVSSGNWPSINPS